MPLHPRLAELTDYLDATRSQLLATLEGVTDEQAARRPADGGWSPLQILEHLRLSERATLRLFDHLLREAEAQAVGPEESTASVLGSLDRFSLIEPLQPLVAPEPFVPQAAPPLAESLAALAEIRENLKARLGQGSGRALGQLTFPHPRLGPLDFYQWVLFTGQHEARHTRQIARRLAEA